MKIKDWFLAQKKKRMAKKQARLQRSLAPEEEPVLRLGDDEPEMPKSRYTEEYKEFLKKQQELEDNGPITREES